MKAVWFSAVFAIVALIVLGVLFAVRASDLRKLDELTRSTNQALCTFRLDLERRTDLTAQFLEDHPEGIPGVSRADLIRSLTNQQATLESLSDLKC